MGRREQVEEKVTDYEASDGEVEGDSKELGGEERTMGVQREGRQRGRKRAV